MTKPGMPTRFIQNSTERMGFRLADLMSRDHRNRCLLCNIGHPLHEVVAVPRHIHLDPVGHAQAARSFRRVVDLGERVLQARVGELPDPAADGEALYVWR